MRTDSKLRNLLEQAKFEIEELSLSAQEDLDDELYDYSGVFEAMAKSLQMLLTVLQGSGEFSDREGLQVIPQVNQLRLIVPIYPLIAVIDSA